jgi:hypothetical protein
MNEYVYLIPILPFGVLLLYMLCDIGRDILTHLRKKSVMRQWEEFKKWYPKEYQYMKDYCLNDPDEVIEQHIREIV